LLLGASSAFKTYLNGYRDFKSELLIIIKTSGIYQYLSFHKTFNF